MNIVKRRARNKDKDGNRVQILQKVIGYTMSRHGGCLRQQVVEDLVVRDPKSCKVRRKMLKQCKKKGRSSPKDGERQEDDAGSHASSDLIDPFVVPCDVLRNDSHV